MTQPFIRILSLSLVALLPAALAAAPSAELPEGYTATPFLSDEPVREFNGAEEVLEAGTDYGAVMVTNKGTMILDLYEEQAPRTVNNFVFLARHRFYDGVVFHRVLEGFMAQTGDPTGTGTGGPGYQFEDEFAPGLQHDRPALLSMANAGPNTNGSQFFMTFAETPWLDGAHAIFGEVAEGAEVLGELQRIDPSQPSAIVAPSDPLSALSEQGVTLAGDASTTVEAYLGAQLGSVPGPGESFELDGFDGVVGQGGGGETLVGFYPEPDVIESLTIIQRPQD